MQGLDTNNGYQCRIMKEYIPSTQEIIDLHKSIDISKVDSFESRFSMLMDYVTSEKYSRNSSIFLDFISLHMKSSLGDNANIKERLAAHDVSDFLSRFEYYIRCSGAPAVR